MRVDRLIAGGALHDPAARAFSKPRPVWLRACEALLTLIAVALVLGLVGWLMMVVG